MRNACGRIVRREREWRDVRWGIPKNVAYRKMAELRLTGLTLAFIASMHTLGTYAASLMGSRHQGNEIIRPGNDSVGDSIVNAALHVSALSPLIMAFDRLKISPRFFLPERIRPFQIRTLLACLGEVILAEKCYARRTDSVLEIWKIEGMRYTNDDFLIVHCSFVENLIDEERGNIRSKAWIKI